MGDHLATKPPGHQGIKKKCLLESPWCPGDLVAKRFLPSLLRSYRVSGIAPNFPNAPYHPPAGTRFPRREGGVSLWEVEMLPVYLDLSAAHSPSLRGKGSGVRKTCGSSVALR